MSHVSDESSYRKPTLSLRLKEALAKAGPKLSVYLVAGHPSLDASFEHLAAAVQGGADWLEFGIPFSDPAADGPVIEAATASAVRAGTTVEDCLELAQRFRVAYPNVPLVAMTYGNVAYQRSWEGWADALLTAGFDACILPDVPLEEAQPIRAALERVGLGWIPLVTPTTPTKRMAAIAATATGFLYVVSSTGTTGQDGASEAMEATVQRARQAIRDANPGLPLVVGFGIRAASDVRRVVEAGAAGAIVGTAIVQGISAGNTPQETTACVAALRPPA